MHVDLLHLRVNRVDFGLTDQRLVCPASGGGADMQEGPDRPEEAANIKAE
jgi:hypothetical protein